MTTIAPRKRPDKNWLEKQKSIKPPPPPPLENEGSQEYYKRTGVKPDGS